MSRFFAKLSLFIFSMVGIVVASNLVMMFIFWELVGVSSYLLIGFWYEKASAAEAAKKAFLSNRVGDFGFLIGIMLFWSLTGTVALGGAGPLLSADPFGASHWFPRHPTEDAVDRHAPRPAPVLRLRRQVRPDPAPRLASRRDGGPPRPSRRSSTRRRWWRRASTCSPGSPASFPSRPTR